MKTKAKIVKTKLGRAEFARWQKARALGGDAGKRIPDRVFAEKIGVTDRRASQVWAAIRDGERVSAEQLAAFRAVLFPDAVAAPAGEEGAP